MSNRVLSGQTRGLFDLVYMFGWIPKMARLKGGSHVAGDLTVEVLITVGGIQLDVDKTLIFSANANLTQNKVAKSDQFNEIIDSNITDTGALITLSSNSKVSGDLEVTGNVFAASVYLEEDGNSSNQLRLLNNSVGSKLLSPISIGFIISPMFILFCFGSYNIFLLCGKCYI